MEEQITISYLELFTHLFNDANEYTIALIIGFSGSFLAGIFASGIGKTIKFLFGRAFQFKKHTLPGIYDCEYHIPWKPEGDNVVYERIIIFRVGIHYYGFLINNPDSEKYWSLERPGFRLKGEILEHYFIGSWADPRPQRCSVGSFNMKIDLEGNHEGQWNGESKSYNKILEGRWIWKKKTESTFGNISFALRWVFGNNCWIFGKKP